MFPAIEADRTTSDKILLAFVKRLRTKIPIFGAQNCFVSDMPIPEQFPEGDLVCTVSIGDGTFPDAFWAGGGHEQLVQDGSITVAVLKQQMTDQPEHADQHLLDESRGFLTVLQPKLLSALLVERVWTEAKDDSALVPWVPMDGERAMLRNLIKPQAMIAPQPIEELLNGEAWLFMSLVFEVVWDWKLEG